MSLVMSDQRAGMTAALTTPFMETDGMCSEVWVMLLGSGDANAEVLVYSENFSVKMSKMVMSNYNFLKIPSNV